MDQQLLRPEEARLTAPVTRVAQHHRQPDICRQVRPQGFSALEEEARCTGGGGRTVEAVVGRPAPAVGPAGMISQPFLQCVGSEMSFFSDSDQGPDPVRVLGKNF